jgi:uncharacterized membrane protein
MVVTGPWREPDKEPSPAAGCLLVFMGVLTFWAMIIWLVVKAIRGG